jgi:hypothetical protein
MKTHSFLSALVVSSLLSFGINTRALGDDQGDNNDDQGENCQGGHIDGSETLIATVVLVATNNAPTNSGGFAKLISENEDGVVSSSFSLCITGLTTGTYDLSVIRKSDGSSVDLGQFVVGGCDHGDGDDNDYEDGNGGDDGEKCCQSGVALDDVPLPSDLDPMDIAQIVISDSDGNVILIGDLVDPVGASNIKFRAKLRIRTASGIASQNGKALALTNARKGKRADRFTMIASGVAPNSTFSVSVNGQSAGTVKSNAKGKVLVRTIPANLLVVKSVHLIDSTGATAVRAKF